MSDYQYPDDEFDAADADGPAPVGVHREQPPAWRRWVPALSVLVIAPILAVAAVAVLRHISSSPVADPTGGGQASTTAAAAVTSAAGEPSASAVPGADGGETATATATASASASGNADMTTSVTVHNGTTTNGLAARTGDRLTNAGFTSVSVAQGVYTPASPTTTTVYYASPENASTAKAVAQALGVTNVVESAEEAASNPIVVILRDDYKE